MRQAFINTITRLAKKDQRIVLLTADLGFTVFESFRRQFPDRFYNVGVAEANMIGMAAGMAQSGLIPITYSIATFASLRPYEFIRNDVCFQNANVKIIGVGGGLGYGSAGFSHTNYEDLSVLRPLPNLTILNPADPVETELLTILAIKHAGPVYLRLGKVGEPVIHHQPPKISIGQGIVYKTGKKIAIFTSGRIAANVIAAKLKATIVILPTIKPLDIRLIKKIALSHQNIFSIEEHSIIGGLGSGIAEVLSELPFRGKFKRLGITDEYFKTVGSQDFLRRRYGLMPDQIIQTINRETK
ncbi:MAG: transketolase C-terminal domain-containing protein [Patescibacteria group bacterium]